MRGDFGYFEEGQLGDIRDITLWRRILALMRPFWYGGAAAVLLSFMVAATSLFLPYLLKSGVDDYILNNDLTASARLAGLTNVALIFAGVVVCNFGTNFLQVLVLEWTGQNIMHRLRQYLFNHLLELDLHFYNNNPTGKLVTRLTNDIQNMHEMVTSVVVTLFNDSIKLISILAILFWLNWRLTFALSLLVPPLIINTLWFSKLAREAFRAIRTSLARINSYIQESLSGVAIVQLFGRQGDTARKFAVLGEDYFSHTMYQIKIFGIFMPLVEVLSAVAVAAIVFFGGSQIISGAMTIGTLVAFLSYMRLFFQPLRELSQKYSIVQSALASAERIFELLDTKTMVQDAPSLLCLSEMRGDIRFENVSFGYEADRPVLKNLDLNIGAGCTVAVVGATGSGKTTLVNLLERFYEPQTGRILLDGHDLRDFDKKWLRSQIGMVMQDVFIIPGSVRENILLDKKMDETALGDVLKKAQLRKVIRELPEGLHTRIGEGGRALSAGQKQLLAFGRVLASNPKILVLDEATSNVDSASEALIEEAVTASLSGRTSIIIAHRLSTIKRADQVVVMQDGVILEQGSHEELMARGGYYHRLVRMEYQELLQ